jgi:photosystem II stability/assembly factor-like uncharacterized protein
MKKILFISILLLPFLSKAQWQECNTPFHGTVPELETFDGYIWAGTLDGGVYRSNNQLPEWEKMNNGLNSYFDKKTKTLKVINGELYLGCRGGLFKRSSANANWIQIINSNNPVYEIAGNSNVLIASFYGDLKRSTDGGNTWQSATTGLPSAANYSITEIVENPITGEFIIGDNYYGLYRSTNQGISWTALGFPPGCSQGSSFVTLLKRINNIIYLGIEPEGLYSWDANSATWTLISSCSSRITDLLIVNDQYITTSGWGVFSAPLSGGSFQYVFGNTTGFNPGSLSLEVSDNVIYIGGNEEGVNTIDTLLQTYTMKNKGMKASSIQYLCGNGNAMITHGIRQHYTWRSTNEFSNSTLSPTTYFQWDDFLDDYSDNQNWYIVLSSKGLQLSRDQGLTFREANNGLPNSALNYNIRSITNTDAGFLVVGSYDGKFYRSVNDSTWSLLADLFSSQESITELVKGGSYLFAGSKNINVSSAHLYRSDDNGQTWQILPGPFQAGMEVWGLTYDGTRLIAGSNGYGTFVSTDFGQTWTTMITGFPGVQVFKKLKSFNGDAFAVSMMDSKIYQLKTNSSSWVCLNPNSSDPIANEVFVQGGTLFMGTVDNGIWKWPNFVTGLHEMSLTGSALFPNPSKNCILKLTNVGALPLKIKISDLLGKVVHEEVISDQRNEISFDGSAFSNGIYSVNLMDQKGKSETHKWIVQ